MSIVLETLIRHFEREPNAVMWPNGIALRHGEIAAVLRHHALPVADRIRELEAQQEARIRELEGDAKRLDWLEEKHTLHDSVEILYVVDGYNVDVMIHDGSTCHSSSHGATLRAALDHAMTPEVDRG